MPDPIEPDPLTQLYAGFWTGLEEHPKFTEMVKAANRVKFNADHPGHARARTKVQAADLPELILTYEGFSGSLRSTSSSSEFAVRWTWVLTTGDMRIDEILLPLSWTILESMVRMHARIKGLSFGGVPFLKSIHLIDARAGESELLRVSNIRGWSAVQSFETRILTATDQMVTAAAPPQP